MCLLQSLIISERFCITLHAILKVVCRIKVNQFFVVKVLINTCIFPKMSVPSEGHFIAFYSSSLRPHWLCPYVTSPFEIGKGNRFC